MSDSSGKRWPYEALDLGKDDDVDVTAWSFWDRAAARYALREVTLRRMGRTFEVVRDHWGRPVRLAAL